MDNLENCAAEKSDSPKIEAVSPIGSSGKQEKKQNGSSPNKNVKKSPSKSSPKGGTKHSLGESKNGQIEETLVKTDSQSAVGGDHSPNTGNGGVGEPRVPAQASPKPAPGACANAPTCPVIQSPKLPMNPHPQTPATPCSFNAKPIGSGLKPNAGSSSVGKPSDKNSKRNREDKLRKKDDKSVEHVLKALSSLETTEEKLGAMCQKYAEIVNEHRILQNAAKLCEKKNSVLQKEKEQLQADHSKAILTRSRLENLCRELQRQNKAVKEECMLKIREEEEKKREVATKFQSTLTELGTLLAQNNDKNAKLRDDNLDMTTKLKSVCEQYERKEQHVEKLAKQMKLEMQLADAKLAKAKMEMAMEKETLLREKQQLLLELSQYQTQLEEMKLSETALRNQIQLYNDKYDEFHKALLQSNEAIGGFKQEMERMSKQIRKLEKETVSWKSRYEAAHRTLLQMTEEKLKSDQNASAANRKLVALQGLCRSLQAQCTSLRSELKGVASSTPVRTDQEEELMSQVEKELNETASEEGLASDSSPCPRQLSRESAEKLNGETMSSEDLSDKEGVTAAAQLPDPDTPQGAADLIVHKGSSPEPVISSPNGAASPNGDLCDGVDAKTLCPPPPLQTKKNKAKKKNKK
uniref:Alpha-taxilin n=1 Tax=Lygus hesperus TaxID=30085 RepID=A0A0K8T116_LYGHE